MLRRLLSWGGVEPPQSSGPIRIDGWLLMVTAVLVSIGFVMMSSASVEYARYTTGASFFYVNRQLINLLVAALTAIAVFVVPMKAWEKYGWLLLVVGFALLLLVVIPGVGKEVNGSRRWLPLGFINLQSSEVAKFCILVYLAGYLVRRQDELRNQWRGFIKPLSLLSLMIVLLLLEPDFGAVVVMVTACLGIIFMAGVRLGQFLALISVSVIAVALMAGTAEYRLARLVCFLDPWASQYDCGYQLTQSLIAFGRGGWFGEGLGNSMQKLFFLPEAHTDFVFAILAEELGLVGAFAVLALFVFLIARIMHIGRSAELAGSVYSAYVAYGAGLLLSAQIFINIGVNTGLLPTKGLTLPFLSYGGTSLMVSFWLLALVFRIDLETRYRLLDAGSPKKKTTVHARAKKASARKRKISGRSEQLISQGMGR